MTPAARAVYCACAHAATNEIIRVDEVNNNLTLVPATDTHEVDIYKNALYVQTPRGVRAATSTLHRDRLGRRPAPAHCTGAQVAATDT